MRGGFASSLFPENQRAKRWKRSFALSFLAGLHQWRAALIVIVFDLTVEALKTFRHDDLARALNRPDRARTLAQMAGIAAFGPTFKKVQKVQAIQNGQSPAERAQKPAECPFRKEADYQKDHRVNYIRQPAHEFGGDGGFERLDFFKQSAHRWRDKNQDKDKPE